MVLVTRSLAGNLPLDCPVASVSTGLGRVDILGLVLLVMVCVTSTLAGFLPLDCLLKPLPSPVAPVSTEPG